MLVLVSFCKKKREYTEYLKKNKNSLLFYYKKNLCKESLC